MQVSGTPANSLSAASLLSGASAGIASATAATATATGPAAAGPSDSVDFSALAKALKGDSLSLFSKLSTDDRTALGGLVASGGLTGEDVQDALLNSLKSARKGQFWEMAKQMPPPDETGSTRIDKEVTAQRSRIGEIGKERRILAALGVSDDDDRVKTLEEETQRLRESVRENVPNARLYIGTSWSMPLGDPTFFQSEREQAAGTKLKEAGFSSASFDATVRETAAADVRAFAEKEGWALP